MPRDGKVMTTANTMKTGASRTRSGAGVKNINSRRRGKGEQRMMQAGRVLKGPTPAS